MADEKGEKRKHEDSEKEFSPNKARKLNESTGSFTLSPINLNRSSDVPKTPDTQPSSPSDNAHIQPSPYKHTPVKNIPHGWYGLMVQQSTTIDSFPEYKNLILTFYAMLDQNLAEKPTEVLLAHEQHLLDFLTQQSASEQFNIKNISAEELKLLDALCETQLQFSLEKLSEAYQNPSKDLADTLSARHIAKFKLDATHENSMQIKTEILKRSQLTPIASQIGKDMYASFEQAAQSTPEKENDLGSSSAFSHQPSH